MATEMHPAAKAHHEAAVHHTAAAEQHTNAAKEHEAGNHTAGNAVAVTAQQQGQQAHAAGTAARAESAKHG